MPLRAGQIVNPKDSTQPVDGRHDLGHLRGGFNEATEIDKRYARYVNKNLADYLIPVNADIREVDVIMIPRRGQYREPTRDARASVNSAMSG